MTENILNKTPFSPTPDLGQRAGRLSRINSPKNICKVLIVDDSPEDRAELRRMLLSGSDRRYQFTEAETGEACLKACLENEDSLPDCVLLDYHLPDYDAPELLVALGGPDSPCCPVLVVTGSSGDINSGAILGQGAQDFISKNWINPESLTRSVENTIERYWLNQELKYSHKRFKAFLENGAVIAWMKDEEGHYSYLSQNFEKRFNVRFEDWRGKTDFEIWPEQMAEQFRSDDLQVLSRNCALEAIEEALNPDGSVGWWFTSKFPFKDQAGRVFVGGLGIDITERKHAELALQESEELNRSILNNSADCIKVIDLEENLVLMNGPGQCAMEIEDFAPFVGRSWASLWPGPDRELVVEALQTARLGGIGRFQGYCPTAKGTPKWWDAVVTAVLDSAGQPKRYVSISRDITERKQIEDALRASADADAYRVTLADALRPLSDPAKIKAEAVRILGEHLQASRVHYAEVINNGQTGVVCADYHVGVSSVVGHHHLDDYGPALMAEFRSGRSLVIPNVAEDSRLTPEEKTRTADLEIGAYILIPLVKDGELVGLLTVHQDKPRDWTNTEIALIAETAERAWDSVQRGHIEKILRMSEEKLAAIVHQASAGLAETDLSGRFTLVNDKFCEMVGRNREELMALCWRDITHPDDLTENEKRFQACVEVDQDFVIEKRYLKPNGATIWVRNNVTLLHNDKGQPMSTLTVSFDIGERRQIEMKLREKTELLSEADRHKNEFLAMLGHELRNPLTPISNVAQILFSESLDQPTLRPVSEILNRNVTHISQLVDDLLDVSRITQGLVNIKHERVELAELLKDSAESIQTLIQSKQQTFNLDLPPQPIYLEGDSVRLTQVFTNLINNAAKYTPEGGRIDLKVNIEGPSVIVRVQDNGIGIEPILLPNIFDLFIQGKRGLDRSEGGLGLGLALVKKLIDLHGGQIMASSQGVNHGSEFVVKLPRIVEASVQVEPQIPQELNTETDQGLKVLLIDDNHDVTDSISMWFEMLGHQVEIASSGEQGLASVQSFHPDIILLDIGLPDMDGYQVARKLREQPAAQRALIIALSGYIPHENNLGAEATSFDHYLMKPPKLNELRNLITEFQRTHSTLSDSFARHLGPSGV